jgi:dTDP-4-dehydrorhamnose reductase
LDELSKMGRPLIVGAAGQVGHQLVRLLDGRVLRSSRTERGPEWLTLDLTEVARKPWLADKLIQDHAISALYCVGGATDVEGCEADPELAEAVNCHGPVALARASTNIPFLYFSTEYVFDGKKGPYVEEDVPCPISAYGRSKHLAEQRILDAHPNPLILRTTVVYGPDPGQKNFLYSLRRILSAGKTMRVPADQVSTPTFNVDLAAATVGLVAAEASGIFHACGPGLMNRYDFAVGAAKMMGLDTSGIQGASTAELQQKAPRPLCAGLVSEKLRRYLPGVELRNVDQGIQEWLAMERAA